MANLTPKQVLGLAQEKKATYVDLKFMDFVGIWQHFTVPLSELTFTDQGATRQAVIEVTLAAAEDTGARSRPAPIRKTISIPAADWEKARGESWAVTGEMKTRTGNLRFVAAVRDVASGRIGLASAPVRVE